MTPEQLAKQIEESNLTEDELNEQNWHRICGNLLHEEARKIKLYNPGSVIIIDELNPGKYLVMKFGPRKEEKRDGEFECESESGSKEETEKVSEDNDKDGQSNDGKVSGPIPDQQHSSPNTQSWFDS